MLTFSNPNYSTSSAEQVSHPENKRSHFWRRFKYDKSQVSSEFCLYYLFFIDTINKFILRAYHQAELILITCNQLFCRL